MVIREHDPNRQHEVASLLVPRKHLAMLQAPGGREILPQQHPMLLIALTTAPMQVKDKHVCLSSLYVASQIVCDLRHIAAWKPHIAAFLCTTPTQNGPPGVCRA